MRTTPLAVLCCLTACQPPAVTGVAGRGGSDQQGGSAGEERDAARDTAPPFFMVPDGGGEVPPAPRACVNLQCRRPMCPGGTTTSLSGTAYAPNGKLPLYNVALYIPNAPLEPLPAGMTCDRCGTLASGKPIASAISDSQGKFRIDNVPAGKEIPLVIQVGKWRRQVVLPEILPCQDNRLTDPQLTRLPRNRREGDLPRVAVTTGQCDGLVCTVSKLGVDPGELGVMGQDRAITFFAGNSGSGPPGMAPARALWNSYDELAKYDFALFSCNCKEYVNDPNETVSNRSPDAFAAVTRYLNAGGRIFSSDYEYVWPKYSPEPALAKAIGFSTPTTKGDGQSPLTIDTGSPKSKALADWLKFLSPTSTPGQLPAKEVFDNLRGPPVAAHVWASSPASILGKSIGVHPRIVTINTPVAAPVEERCGRLAHFDVHLGERPPPPQEFPAGCGAELSEAEHALVFFLFDLAACIQEDDTPPAPPALIP